MNYNKTHWVYQKIHLKLHTALRDAYILIKNVCKVVLSDPKILASIPLTICTRYVHGGGGGGGVHV